MDILKTPIFLSSSFSPDVIILPYLEIWIQVNKHFKAFFKIPRVFVVMRVTTTKSTAVHDYQLESCFT